MKSVHSVAAPKHLMENKGSRTNEFAISMDFLPACQVGSQMLLNDMNLNRFVDCSIYNTREIFQSRMSLEDFNTVADLSNTYGVIPHSQHSRHVEKLQRIVWYCGEVDVQLSQFHVVGSSLVLD